MFNHCQAQLLRIIKQNRHNQFAGKKFNGLKACDIVHLNYIYIESEKYQIKNGTLFCIFNLKGAGMSLNRKLKMGMVGGGPGAFI
ncbi:hypothetical protein ACFLZ8_03865, partial [Planctomycetota bacterium]